MSSRALALVIGLGAALPAAGVAQSGGGAGAAGAAGAAGPAGAGHSLGRPLFVNDEWERYARVRQIAGDAPAYPWTIREFTRGESDSVSRHVRSHPWESRETAATRRVGPAGFAPLPAGGEVIYNSAFPFGYNDGQVWAGRGLTTAMSAGVQASWGPLWAALAPRITRAENASFVLGPTGLPGALGFGDPFGANAIDQPQRFGDDAYQQIALDNTRVELVGLGAVLAFSTAAQHWGPARDHPLVLGNNAAGFPHVLLGTGRPVNLRIARAHARLIWGRLDATAYTDTRQEERYRFATGIAAVLEPAFAPGLELGISRFFHIRWSDNVINRANLTRSFIGLVRDTRVTATDPLGDEPDNQLASAFARWVFPASGFEVYGEFAKDDYNKDARDLALEPDHISGYLVGLHRVVKRPGRYLVFRGEILNTRLSPLTLNRPQSPFYIHSHLRQGHTNAGQVLGSAAAFGGGATVLGVDRYAGSGRTTLSWSRMMRAEYRPTTAALPVPGRADLFHAITLDGLLFRGRLAFNYELTSVYEINRHFAADAFNLRAATGVQITW